MANTTARGALNIHGTNPQFLVEKIVRARIYDSPFWKEHCFGLTACSLIPKALELQYVGGLHGLQRPSPFLCLLQKLLQLQPEKDIIIEYLKAQEFKYLRAVAAMYVRMTFRAVEVYELLEPMLNDYRKLRWRDLAGNYSLTHMDVFVDSLLKESRVCDIILPRLAKRDVLEEVEGLAPCTSKLENVLLLGKAGLEEESGAESDDSAAEARRERRFKLERAARLRAVRSGEQEEQEDVEYASQEESEPGYVSTSPSGSGSPDGYVSRSPSHSPERFVSRSPSRSP